MLRKLVQSYLTSSNLLNWTEKYGFRARDQMYGKYLESHHLIKMGGCITDINKQLHMIRVLRLGMRTTGLYMVASPFAFIRVK